MKEDLKIGDVAVEKVADDLVAQLRNIEYRRDFVRREMTEIEKDNHQVWLLIKDRYEIDVRYGYSLNHDTGRLIVIHINKATPESEVDTSRIAPAMESKE